MILFSDFFSLHHRVTMVLMDEKESLVKPELR